MLPQTSLRSDIIADMGLRSTRAIVNGLGSQTLKHLREHSLISGGNVRLDTSKFGYVSTIHSCHNLWLNFLSNSSWCVSAVKSGQEVQWIKWWLPSTTGEFFQVVCLDIYTFSQGVRILSCKYSVRFSWKNRAKPNRIILNLASVRLTIA